MLGLPSSLLSLLFVTASANPVAQLAERQAQQQINIQFTISEAQFRTFENSNTLRSYFQSQGYNYNLNYAQLSQGVAIIDQYYAARAAQTTPSSSNNGFPVFPGATEPQTFTDSTSLRGGPSYTNNSMSADQNLVSVISFSDGNAATAGGAIQRTFFTESKTSSGTSSAGASNSTATVTGNPALIDVTSTVVGATDRRTVAGNPQDALTAGDCAASANGASARSTIQSFLTIPVNVTSPLQSVRMTATSFCEAGVSAKRANTPGGSGTSIGSTQAALTSGGVAAVVFCNGQRTDGVPSVVYGVNLQGTYSITQGFRGTFVGSRTASVSVSCS